MTWKNVRNLPPSVLIPTSDGGWVSYVQRLFLSPPGSDTKFPSSSYYIFLVLLILALWNGNRNPDEKFRYNFSSFSAPLVMSYGYHTCFPLVSLIPTQVRSLHSSQVDIKYLVVGTAESNWKFMTYHDESRTSKLIGNFNAARNKRENRGA